MGFPVCLFDEAEQSCGKTTEMMDLLDTTIFSCSMCCGIVILFGRNLQLGFGALVKSDVTLLIPVGLLGIKNADFNQMYGV